LARLSERASNAKSEETSFEIRAPPSRPQSHFRRSFKSPARQTEIDKISMVDVHDAIKLVDASAEVACLCSERERYVHNLSNLMEVSSEEVRIVIEAKVVFLLVEGSASCYQAVLELLKRYSSSGGIVIPVLMEQFTLADRAGMSKRILTMVQNGADDVVVLPASARDIGMSISASLAKGMAHRRVLSDFQKQLRDATKQCDQLFWQVAHEILPEFPEERTHMHEIPERRVGNLALVGKLGQGAFGTVHKCKNVESGESCVVKILPKSCVKSYRQLQQIVTEYSVLRRASHPNVVSGINFVHGVKNLYILMEMAGSRNLFRMMQAESARGLLWPKVNHLLLQIAAGVAHLHEKGIAHCDLKPENIAIGENCCVKIVDFGQAVDVTDEIPNLQNPRGTMPFIPPEVMCLSSEWDPIACDMWQVGVILFEMLCGNDSFVHFMDWRGKDLMSLDQLQQCAEELAAHFDESTKASTLTKVSSLCRESLPASAMELLTCMLELKPKRRLHAKDVESILGC